MHNGKTHDSDTMRWSEISERTEVNYFGNKKIVHLAKGKVKSLRIFHDGLSQELKVPEGCRVFQATRSETVFLPNDQVQNRIIGKIMGIVKDGVVIEEVFIDGQQHKVLGIKL